MSDTVNHWVLYGQRRWARVVLKELCSVIQPGELIQLPETPACREFVEWITSESLDHLVVNGQQLTRCPPGQQGVALVVNSAFCHPRSIYEALDAGYNVVSEKPVGFSALEISKMLSYAYKKRLRVFSTNTFRFATYLDFFRRELVAEQEISAIKILWHDPESECRNGERKRYDSSIPIIVDVMPHIACIIHPIAPRRTFRLSRSEIIGDGSTVRASFVSAGITLEVDLRRNAGRRRRLLHVGGEGFGASLDFTDESLLSYSVNEGVPQSAVSWLGAKRPIASMLEAVNASLVAGVDDERLDFAPTFLSQRLVDSLLVEYVSCQDARLSSMPWNDLCANPTPYSVVEALSMSRRILESGESVTPSLAPIFEHGLRIRQQLGGLGPNGN